MADSSTGFRAEVLAEEDWPRLRDIRLSALRDDPLAFLATLEREAAYSERRWREEFSRGEWNIVCADDHDVGLVGVTREPGKSPRERHLEFLWVAPDSRRNGVATALLRTVLDRLRDSEVRTVWLWVLNGNDPARRLYEQFGFQSTNERQPLPDDPGRSEERMRLRLC